MINGLAKKKKKLLDFWYNNYLTNEYYIPELHPEPRNEAVRKAYKSHAKPIPHNRFIYHISSYTIPVPYFHMWYTRHNVAKLPSTAANTLQQLSKIPGLKFLQRLWKLQFCGTLVRYDIHITRCHTRRRNLRLTERFAYITYTTAYKIILSVTNLRKIHAPCSKPMKWHSWTNFRQYLPSLCHNH